MLSEETIKEFRQILEEEYGKELTQAEAAQIAQGFVGYFDLLAKLHHREREKSTNE